MVKNSLWVTNQKAGKWSCDQSGKLSNRTSTSAGEVGTPVAVVVMNLMETEVNLTTQLWVYKLICC